MKVFFFFFLIAAPLLAFDDFDQCMGKESGFYRYLQKPEDLACLTRFREIYERSEDLLAHPSGEGKIPRVVHFIWLGPRPFPLESVENVRTWVELHPDWTFKLWTDRDRHLPCAQMQKVLVESFSFHLLEKEYRSSKNWGEKADILRYEILFREGGIYVDHDANCLCSFLPLADSFDLFCGLEAPHPLLAGQNLTLGNGVIGARSGHPLIEETLKKIASRWERIGHAFRGEDGFNRTERVLNRTYTALTEAVKENIGKGETRDLVLPAAYFFAKGGIPSLYSRHFYRNAWADDDPQDALQGHMKRIHKIEQKIKRVHILLVAILGIQLIWLGFRLKKRKKA
ncbi:MAG TPA: hypothetical protein DCY54_04805 [Parachlamydiales bacterium]|nr:MAG: hypothetical protein A3D18_05390 [Chlamydiae bacterium RIFCSPHIGHO2_02_FULL_49_29]OGN70738.1 MAG: hypothetical protein A3G30_05965 [Chlamydiae bacterium RIFCSPLOWO2_12_FULL_49_12]OGN71144.1 MAG: hypothetical protein A3I15_01500 [Chlamydiae bacterium RIFCSPLOWO2_02_FULL_49_12]HAZ15933.1 hypothetical protein [Parachlamydiales bacterium]